MASWVIVSGDADCIIDRTCSHRIDTLYRNDNHGQLDYPPPIDWQTACNGTAPLPTVTLTGSALPENPGSGSDDSSGSGSGGAVAGCFVTTAAYGSSVEP